MRNVKVIVLSGVPGSGKSSYAEVLKRKHFPRGAVEIFSSDHYMVDEQRQYAFNRERLPETHARCLREFIAACVEYETCVSPTLLVVDNTHTTAMGINTYLSVARAFGYTVEVHMLHVKPHAVYGRNVHGVPNEVVDKMYVQQANLLANWPSDWARVDVRR